MKFALWLLLILTVVLFRVQPVAAALEQVYSFNIRAEPETIDPALATGMPEYDMMFALFEGLTNRHAKTLEPIPGVAKRWDISKDGRRYTFHIRNNARWSNGDAVTAQDFVYSWRRSLEPKTGAIYAYMLYHIRGAKAYNSGKIKDFNKVGIKARSSHILEVELINPTPYFLFLCSYYVYFPVHRRTVEKHGDKWTRVENIVTNGAFTLKEWRQADRIVMEKFSGYWDAKRVRLQRIHAYPIENKETGLNYYKTNKIHWTGHGHLPEARIERLKKRPDYHQPVWLSTYYYRVNVTRPPLNNLDVRKALYLAIDRDLIVQKVTKTGEQPAFSFTPKMRGYQPPRGPVFNPKKAAEHLSKAGYCAPGFNKKGCKPFPKLEVHYNTNERHKLVLLAIQQMWKQHLGIEGVSLLNREWKVYLKEQRAIDYAVSRSTWIADYPDPTTFIEMFVTDGGHNQTGWSNRKYDQLVEAAYAEVDAKKRQQLLIDAETILLAELPILPIYHLTSPFLLSPCVGGFYENYLDIHPYTDMYIKPECLKEKK